MNRIITIKSKIIPYKFPFSKKRLGRGDGGYVVTPDLINDRTQILSYGIGDDTQVCFESQLKDKVDSLHMYDASVNDAHMELNDKTFFHKEFLNSENFRDHCLNIDQSHMVNNLLKIDIEGCEYEWLTEENLELAANNFGQLAIEIHGLIPFVPAGWVIDPPVLEAKKDENIVFNFLDKVDRSFQLFHIHGNNHSPMKHGLPDCLELTYINKKVFESTELDHTPCPVVGLDQPNHIAVNDYFLNWWV